MRRVLFMRKKRRIVSEIKKLDKMIPAMEEKLAKEYLCEDGKAQIDVYLYDGAEILHPLSFGKQRELTNDIYDLIDEKLHKIPLKFFVRICFHGQIPSSQVQEQVRELMQQHYMHILRDKKADLRVNFFKTIWMTVVGIVLLSTYFTLELISSNPVFMEFLSIAGWVAAWEAVDSWVLQRKEIQMEYLHAGRAALCEILFADGLPSTEQIYENEENKL